MDEKFKKAALFISIPVTFNLVLSTIIFFVSGLAEFLGFLTGALACACLSVIWLIQIRIGFKSNSLNFLKIVLMGFGFKILLLIGILIGSSTIIQFDKIYFIIAFFIGISASLGIEVWFYKDLGRTVTLKKDEEK